MKKANKLMLAAVLAVALPTGALAAEADLQARLDKLTQQMEDLKGQVERIEDKSLGKWLSIGGDYRFRIDSLHGKTASYMDGMTFGMMYNLAMSGYFTAAYGVPAGNPAAAQAFAAAAAQVPAYKPKNETLYTNRFSLDLKAKATQDVTVNVKLGMYKVFGDQSGSPAQSNFFGDRAGVFDGTIGHVPSDSKLNVDRAYATWSNIMDQPIWFSAGRRPSTNGAPTNLKANTARPGNGGTPAILVDYAFDGMTLGYAPDIEMLPGFYAKVCYGRGFESGYKAVGNEVKDTDMLGVAIIPIDTDPLRVWLQWNRGFNIFDNPAIAQSSFNAPGLVAALTAGGPVLTGMATNAAGGNFNIPFGATTNLGSIDWFGGGAMTTLKKFGPGDLNFFADFGVSMTHANSNQGMMGGMMSDPGQGKAPDRTGFGVYTGLRYDLPSKTKIGAEYNYGSKYWITMAPAADDMWTAKVATRGHVIEPYVIQELDLKPISSFFAKTFFKLGYQYYDFEYTGSGNWVGDPKKISSVNTNTMLFMAPLKEAHNIYGTFEVHF